MSIASKELCCHGWINLYKPRGISSAKAVAKIKYILNTPKVGHAGTLDVEAEGVLPIAIGEATKLVSYLVEQRKWYVFTMKFGASTDSGDSSGKIEARSSYIPTYEDCLSVEEIFRGEIIQVPPKYSALKINGVRAYHLARQGQDVNLAPRKVTIFDLKLQAYDLTLGTATYIAECSKGTYIRTLSYDIALYLQSLSFVIELARTRVGCFSSDYQSINLETLNNVSKEVGIQYINNCIMNPQIVLHDIPSLVICKEVAQKVHWGQLVSLPELPIVPRYHLLWLKYNDKLVAIGKLENNYFRALRVFNFFHF